MISPTRTFTAALLLLTLLGILAGFFDGMNELWRLGASLLLGACVIDGIWSFRRPSLEFSRTLHHSLPVTVPAQVTILLKNRDNRKLDILLHDQHPADWTTVNLPLAVSLAPAQELETHYSLQPPARGDFTLPGCNMVVTSPLSLWQKKWFFPCQSKVRVFPNFREISHYTLLATHHKLSQMGIKKRLRRGEGREFHQLREFRQGDELQRIDWKATSRVQKLISKEYQDERDQQIVFVLDSGRRMSHREKGGSHLDQALNSILLLGYVAGRQGDAVGLYSFGQTNSWHPPRKESVSERALLFAAYGIQSGPEASDYLKATQDILTLQQRRSLMLIITNSRSEDYDDLLHMVKKLRHKHLVVIADLRETSLDQAASSGINSLEGALRFQALQHYLVQRKKLFAQLNHLGVTALDITADQLPAAVVNCYLEIKRTGSL